MGTIEFLVITAFLLFCFKAACAYGVAIGVHRSSAEAIRIGLLEADQRVTNEYHHTRRAMNDVAGQSWRNLAG